MDDDDGEDDDDLMMTTKMTIMRGRRVCRLGEAAWGMPPGCGRMG